MALDYSSKVDAFLILDLELLKSTVYYVGNI